MRLKQLLVVGILNNLSHLIGIQQEVSLPTPKRSCGERVHNRMSRWNDLDARLIGLQNPGRVLSCQKNAGHGRIRCWRCGEWNKLS